MGHSLSLMAWTVVDKTSRDASSPARPTHSSIWLRTLRRRLSPVLFSTSLSRTWTSRSKLRLQVLLRRGDTWVFEEFERLCESLAIHRQPDLVCSRRHQR